MKKIIIGISFFFLALYLVFRYSFLFGLCDMTDYQCRIGTNNLMAVVTFAPFFFLVSLSTVYMPHYMFERWWRFAWWGGPLTIAFVMLVNAGFHHTSGGWLNLSTALDGVATYSAYALFSLGSLVQLYRARAEQRQQ